MYRARLSDHLVSRCRTPSFGSLVCVAYWIRPRHSPLIIAYLFRLTDRNSSALFSARPRASSSESCAGSALESAPMRLRLAPCKPRRGIRATRGLGAGLPGRTWACPGPQTPCQSRRFRQRPRRNVFAPRAPLRSAGVGGELEMPQDAANDGSVGESGDDPQGTQVTSGASFQVDGKDPLEQPRPKI